MRNSTTPLCGQSAATLAAHNVSAVTANLIAVPQCRERAALHTLRVAPRPVPTRVVTGVCTVSRRDQPDRFVLSLRFTDTKPLGEFSDEKRWDCSERAGRVPRS